MRELLSRKSISRGLKMLRGRKIKKALVLSGGSARGLAHVGVIEVLMREGIHFDLVVGTSIGALAGATYCLGLPIEHTLRIARKTTIRDLLDITISRMGLTDGNKLEALIRSAVDNKGFADLKIPIAITAVDIETGEDLCFTSGDLIKAIKASCSLPGIFRPVEMNGRLLVDGGIRHHLPTAVAKALGADIIVAVDVGFCVKNEKINNMLGVIMQSIQILGERLSMHQSEKADILIKPDLGKDIDQLAFDKSALIIRRGQEAAEEALPRVKKYMEENAVWQALRK